MVQKGKEIGALREFCTFSGGYGGENSRRHAGTNRACPARNGSTLSGQILCIH